MAEPSYRKPELGFPASVGSRRRGLLTLWAQNWGVKGGEEDQEEAMYKELFLGMIMDTLPSEFVVPDDVTDIKRAFCFITTTVVDITLGGFTVNPSVGANFLYSSPQCKVVRTPNLTVIASSLFNSGNALEDWYAPSLESFSSTYALNTASTAAINRLHIGKTCDEIRAMKNFPWTNQEYIRQKLKFVGTDGTLSWDGSAWVKS